MSVPKILLPWATQFILLKLFEIDDDLQFSEQLLGQAFDLGISALFIWPPPTNKVLANALVALTVSLEIDVDEEDALIADKSWAIGSMVRVICQRISVILGHKAVSSVEGVPSDRMNRACRLILPIIELCETRTEAIAESHRVLAALTPQVVQRASSLQGNQTGTAVRAYTERWTAKVSELLSSQDQSERLIAMCPTVPAVWEEIKAENVIFGAEVIQCLAELTNEYAGLLTRQIPGASVPIKNLKGNIRASSALIAQGGYQVEKEEQAKGMLQALNVLLQHKALETDSSVEKTELFGGRRCRVVEREEWEPSNLLEGQNRTDNEHSR
ncbi:hypothetical protein M407DRAFT_25302 [Tulasnella calospora MUT 4182]|uniref:Uncharacterized protein n=1 Tax=Tulasnella calospora MUT 4182 TaxID=1051891 RepID=A0A0C3QHV7_9AGAM|nr:hypothetical protein M407DRAFT_25302 [Tulasnella calospora MUT 4182]